MRTDPIDAVITWVDGSDKRHAQKLADYCAEQGIDRKIEAAAPTRFNERGELHYCVHSLLRFAPWIRTIYIVTDEQIPPIIESLRDTNFADKIKLIDHRAIFSGYEAHLPTFNSLSIETLLWRIEGIANRFIYLNDDFSLIRPVKPEDFFRDDKLVLRGSWKVQMAKKWRNYWKKMLKPQSTPPKNAHRAVQEKSAQLAGFNKHFFHLPHAPYPALKSTFESYFSAHPDLFVENLRYPLRDHRQYWPLSLAQHIEIQRNNVIFDKTSEVITIHGGCHSFEKIKAQLARADKQLNIPFICLQSIDEAPESTQKYLLEWLETRIAPGLYP
jgi:hypothetical protein